MERETQIYPESIISWRELVGLAFLPAEEKSRLMRDNPRLMMSVLGRWEGFQADFREKDESDRLAWLLLGELAELREREERELELAESKPSEGEWWEWDDALERWEVVSEMADVVVLLHAWLRSRGVEGEELGRIMNGEEIGEYGGYGEYGKLVRKLKERAAALGMDLVEAVILKTGINLQHRPPSLKAKYRKDGFMRRMRYSIGDGSSQIPDLGQVWGETVLTRLQAKCFSIHCCPINWTEPLPPLDKRDYGGLYR